jgi:long-chain acyl-CoA synthetase
MKLLHRSLSEWAAAGPDRPAVTWVDRDRTLTYGEAATLTERIAGALDSLGVGPGDRVALFAHNGLDYVMGMFGAWRLGAVAVPLSVAHGDELRSFLDDSAPVALIYTHDQRAAVDRALVGIPSPPRLVCMDGPQEGAVAWADLLASAEPPPSREPTGDDPALLTYPSTRGPTGRATTRHLELRLAAECLAERLRSTEADRSLVATTLSSLFTVTAALVAPIVDGGRVLVLKHWSADSGWDALDTTGATVVCATPPVLADVAAVSRAQGRPPSGLRVAVCGPRGLSPRLREVWTDSVGVPLLGGYVVDELPGLVTCSTPDGPGDRGGSAGTTLPDKELRVLGPNGRDAGIGTVGDLVVRSVVAAPSPPGEEWIRTSDRGSLDDRRRLTLDLPEASDPNSGRL